MFYANYTKPSGENVSRLFITAARRLLNTAVSIPSISAKMQMSVTLKSITAKATVWEKTS